MNTPGVVYTPLRLAHRHAARALQLWRGFDERAPVPMPSVIDTACGDGSLLRAARHCGVTRLYGTDVDSRAIETAARDRTLKVKNLDALQYSWKSHYDIALGNPPWIGKVSNSLGVGYAKTVAKRFAPNYNASSDLSAAFVLLGAEIADQISYLCTNTIMQGRTFRSGIQKLLLSGEWAMIHAFDEGASFQGLGVRPSSKPWPKKGVNVHYVQIHLVRTSTERFQCYRGGAHWMRRI